MFRTDCRLALVGEQWRAGVSAREAELQARLRRVVHSDLSGSETPDSDLVAHISRIGTERI